MPKAPPAAPEAPAASLCHQSAAAAGRVGSMVLTATSSALLMERRAISSIIDDTLSGSAASVRSMGLPAIPAMRAAMPGCSSRCRARASSCSSDSESGMESPRKTPRSMLNKKSSMLAATRRPSPWKRGEDYNH